MDSSLAKSMILAGGVMIILIRIPFNWLSLKTRVRKSRKGPLELFLLMITLGAFLFPLLWIATPVLAFADYRSHSACLAFSAVCLSVGVGCFYRSHVDLGRNWSVTLEIREGHTLVTRGLYRFVRHPMYSSLLLYSLGHAAALPNWVAGPPLLVSFVLLFLLRVGPEERLMLEEFGPEYEAYRARTKRLVPGLW